MKYDQIEKSADLPHKPWPGSYWATTRGGISYRWSTKNKSEDYKDHQYALPTEAELKKMSTQDIAKLSPSEKYDLWLGHYDLPATRAEKAKVIREAEFNKKISTETDPKKKDKVPTWMGICNGWSLASLMEPQPMKEVSAKNAVGQTILFYPDDIKALTSQVYYDYQIRIPIPRLGSSCVDEVKNGVVVKSVHKDGDRKKDIRRDDAGRPLDLECRDINPSTLHAVLAQYIAKGKPFVFDRVNTEQIWNQPVVGYTLSFGFPLPAVGPHRAKDTVKEVKVYAELRYISESNPGAGPITDMKNFAHYMTLKYTLELDKEGYVIGGEWDDFSEVPDFLWKPSEPISDQPLVGFSELRYSEVKKLISASQPEAGDQPIAPPSPEVVAAPTTAPQPTIAPPAQTVEAHPFVTLSNRNDLGVLVGLKTGARIWEDSGSSVVRVDDKLRNANYVRTRIADWKSTAAELLQIDVAQAATLYIGVDKAATNHTWLTKRGFQKSQIQLATNHEPSSPMTFFEKPISAGSSVSLPGQNIDGDTGAQRNYVVLFAQ